MNASLNELFISVQPWINDTTALSEANTFYGNRLQLRSEALGSVVPKLLQTIRSGKPFAFDSPLVEGNYPRVLLAAGLLMEKPCDISLVDAAASSWVRGAIEEIGRTGRAPVMPPLIAAIERRNTSTREIYEMIEKGEFTPVVVGRFQRARTLLGVP
jgi:hypothetical protein